MKGIEIFCASQPSTAICHSMYEASSSSSPSFNTVQLGGRAIDRHNPIIRDPIRTPSRDLTTPQSPSLSSSSSSPYHQPQKSKKSSGSKPSKKSHDQKKKKNDAGRLSEHIADSYCSKPIESVLRKSWVKPPSNLITPPGSSRYLLTHTSISYGASDYNPVLGLTPFDGDNNKKEAQDVHHQDQTNHASKPSISSPSKPSKKGHDQKKKKNGAGRLNEHIANSYCSKPVECVLRKSWVKPPSDLITPPDSSRYLLTRTSISDGASDYDPVLGLTPFDGDNNKKKAQDVHHQDQTNHASKPSSSSPSEPASSNQVVVLRVSLHCRGCAGKLRKHLSRMEGVTSFNIDFAAKKVTIVGDVTPLSVLASVSKVKNAEFWPLSASPHTNK